MSTVAELFGRAVSLGITPQMPSTESKYIQITNALGLVMTVVSAVQIPLTAMYMPASFVFFHVFTMVGCAVPLWLNACGWPGWASSCFGYATLLGIVGMAITGGGSIGIHFYLLVHAVGPWLYFTNRHKAPMFGVALLALAAFTVLSVYFAFIDPAPVFEAPTTVARAISSLSLFSVFSSLVAFGFYSRTQSVAAERIIEAERARLDEANQQLRDTQAQLVHSEKMAAMGLLVAGVAHDLNTPVGALMGQQSTLLRAVDKLEPRLDGLEDKRVTRTLDVLRSGLAVIGDAAERVKGIVDRLRHFARLDQAELQVSDINEGVRDTVGVLGDQLGRGVVVDLSLSEMADLTCYPAQLNQAITNLLLNAAQAMPDGGTIRITTDSDDDHVRIAVRDEGDGIAPDILDRIFDPGFTTRGVGLGGGMGLAIVHRIVDLHGGSSDVSSKLGVGTTVAIALPRERTSDDADD